MAELYELVLQGGEGRRKLNIIFRISQEFFISIIGGVEKGVEKSAVFVTLTLPTSVYCQAMMSWIVYRGIGDSAPTLGCLNGNETQIIRFMKDEDRRVERKGGNFVEARLEIFDGEVDGGEEDYRLDVSFGNK